jgi:hypothetical protein
MDRVLAMLVRALAIVMLTVALSAPADAANPALRADVQPLALRARTNAPVIIDIKLHSRQQAILEGVLELEVMAEREPIYRVRTPELALAPGTMTQRMLLPAASMRAVGNRGLEARVLFVMKKETHDLGWFPLTGERSTIREYVIGSCTTGFGAPREQPKLWQALRPELLYDDARKVVRQIGSGPVPFSPEDLPSAMGLCAFDVIAVEGPAFAALTEKQLDSLATWVEAGGSLCVVPSAPLNAEHLAFLNVLAAAPGEPAAVTLDPGSALTIHGGPMLFRRPGLGRLVIAQEGPGSEADLTSPPWKRVSSFLAKARAEPSRSPTRQYRYYEVDRFSEIQGALFAQLPRTSRMIPLPVVGAILGAFVLAVGPGEWFILGRLRRRRWTWITFPLLAAGFTLLGVRTAEYYLGRNDKHAALVITDVGQDGRVLRENRFDLRMTGRDKIANLEMQQKLGAICESSREWFGSNPPDLVFQGQVPGRYTMSVPLQQWKPVIVRTMTLGPGAEVPDIQWPDVTSQRELLSSPSRYMAEFARNRGWAVRMSNQERHYRVGATRVSEGLLNKISFLYEEDSAVSATLPPSGRADSVDLAVADPTDSGEWLITATKWTPDTIHIVRRIYSKNE